MKVDGKTRRRRIVPLEPKAVALLAACPLRRGGIAPGAGVVRRFKRAARAVLCWTAWPKDVLRHTAASYLLAKHKNAGLVALWLGNSEKILMSHYHEPVCAENCGRFWEIKPAVGSSPACVARAGTQSIAGAAPQEIRPG